MLEGPPNWFHRAVGWLASAYYLSWAVGILGAAVAMAAGLPAVGPVLRNLLYYLCAIFILLLALLVSASRRERRNAGLLNPHLVLERSEDEYWVAPDGFRNVERDVYHATGTVDVIVLSYSITGNVSADLRLLSAGELRGPVIRMDEIYYQVILREPLAKGDKYTLEFELIVHDPGRTMKPFITEAHSRCASFGSVDLTIHFIHGKVGRVFYYTNKQHTGPLNAAIVELFPSSDGTVKVNEPRVQAGYEYSISWSWADVSEEDLLIHK